jgi:uncharacterized protein (DUF58 family)
MTQPSTSGSSGVYAELDDLIRLKYTTAGFSLRPNQPVHSVLAGRKSSTLRGRGLDFSEIRGYLPGDDVRNIDWKATARLRKAHVRVYQEERDRPCLLIIDQRIAMFFGSQQRMKSVSAAQVAALAVWRVLEEGDRIGALVFNDTELILQRPLRSESNAMRILDTVVKLNHKLQIHQRTQSNPSMLNKALQQATREVKHDALVVVISDFDGADEQTKKLFSKIASHNDTLAIHVSDPLEHQLPSNARLAFQQDDKQLEIDTSKSNIQERYAASSSSRVDEAVAFLRRVGTPVLSLTTTEPVFGQICSQLGNAGGSHR